MRSTFLTGIIVIFLGLSTTAVRGDMGFQSDLKIRLRFENLDDYPGNDFYLKYGHSRGNPYSVLHLTRVSADIPIKLEGEGSRLTQVYLLVVPHGQQPTPPPSDSSTQSRTWLTDATPDTLLSPPLDESDPGPHISSSDGYLLSYRVKIEGDKLEVSRTKAEIAAGDWIAGRWITITAGVVLSAALVGTVLLVLRWVRKRSLAATHVVRSGA